MSPATLDPSTGTCGDEEKFAVRLALCQSPEESARALSPESFRRVSIHYWEKANRWGYISGWHSLDPATNIFAKYQWRAVIVDRH